MALALRSMVSATVATVQEFLDDRPFQLAGALSYYTLLSMAPLLLVVIATAGLFLGDESVRAQLLEQMQALVGRDGAALVDTVLANASSPGRSLVSMTIGIAVLLFGATTVFAQLQAALNQIWRVEAAPANAVWGFIQHRLLSLALVLSVGFLLLVSLVVSALLAGLQGYLDDFLPGAVLLWRGLNIAVSFGLITLLIAMMFKFLPDARVAWQDIWFGAAVTTVLFTIGKFAIGVYLGQASVGSSYGAAGSVIVLMVWIYYASLILFFGAKITHVMARQRGARIEPSDHAQSLETH